MKKIILTALIALFAVTIASAQDKGNWAVGPKIGLYTHAGGDGIIFGVGAMGRYSFSDNWRVEPSIIALTRKGCSMDFSADVHYLFNIAPKWNLYPLAGISANDIGGWSAGINLGGGADFEINRNWDITASLKWMIQTAKYHRNPIIIGIGGTYKF